MRVKSGLVIGGARIDVTGEPPAGFTLMSDLKVPAKRSSYEWGGSAARAVLCILTLGGMELSFMTKGSDDIMGRAFRADMKLLGIQLYEYVLEQFPGAIVMPQMGKRDVILLDSPDDNEEAWGSFPRLDLSRYDGVYSDGKLPTAAIHHFKMANQKGIPTLLDGCAGRKRTEEMLRNTRYAIVSSYLCEERGLSQIEMLEFLKSCGCEIGAVTLGSLGLVFYEKDGSLQYLPGLVVPSVKNSNGAGDVLHALVFRDLIRHPERTWREHFVRGRAAASHVVQHVKDRLPTDEDIAKAMQLPESRARPEWLPEDLRRIT